MRKIELEQGSPEWLEWRKGLLTATDAASIMGISPYQTAYQCWHVKLGRSPGQKVNAAMRRGQADEPRAREMFNALYDMIMIPCCIESDEYPHMGASLDGLSECGKYILEVKSQSIKKIKENGIPHHHFAQIQHQFMCTDKKAEKCFYETIEGDEIFILEVFPDNQFQKDYQKSAEEFWRKIILMEAPPLTSDDYRDMSGVGQWDSFSREYKKISEEIKVLETIKKSYRDEIIKMCGPDNCIGSGIQVIKKSVRGRIDYPALIAPLNFSNEEIERFREPASENWTILLKEERK